MHTRGIKWRQRTDNSKQNDAKERTSGIEWRQRTDNSKQNDAKERTSGIEWRQRTDNSSKVATVATRASSTKSALQQVSGNTRERT